MLQFQFLISKMNYFLAYILGENNTQFVRMILEKVGKFFAMNNKEG